MSGWCSEKLVFCDCGNCKDCPYENSKLGIDKIEEIKYNKDKDGSCP